MTNKEAIEIIKENCYIFNMLNFDRTTLVNTALDKAIEALEQTDTLDKIITQIEQVRDKDKLCEYPYVRCINILKEVLE